jgi:predicted nucleotidyltransferase
MPMNLAVPTAQIAEFRRRNRIRRLAFFGSVVRDDFGPLSDVDVLVEFEPGAPVGLFEVHDMEQSLSQMFGGRTVQISTPRWLSKYFRDRVLAEAEVAYVAA